MAHQHLPEGPEPRPPQPHFDRAIERLHAQQNDGFARKTEGMQNYLYFAEKHGAQVFAEARVVDVAPLNGGLDGSQGCGRIWYECRRAGLGEEFLSSLDACIEHLAEPGASITWAREIKNLNKKLLTPTVLDTIIRRANDNEITNSKDIRRLRSILRDPVGRDKFLGGGTIDEASGSVPPEATKKRKGGLVGDIDDLSEALKRYP